MSSFVITGASSGIGEACVRALACAGHTVFAGVRREDDGERLSRSFGSNVVPVALDVSNEDSVDVALESVRTALGDGGALHGLVNNAGSTVIGPVELLPAAKLREQMEVNVVGPLVVTQRFLPLLREGRGRIVNMGSLMAHLTFPFAGPYSGSKAALRSLTNALRLELRPWQLHVALIEPGNVRTGIWDKHIRDVRELLEGAAPDQRALYEAELAQDVAMIRGVRHEGVPPEEVARAVAHALTSERPRDLYRVGREAKVFSRLAYLLPGGLRDQLIMHFFERG